MGAQPRMGGWPCGDAMWRTLWRAEHERLSAERDQLAEEMERMAAPIVQIAHIVSKIAACDREIGQVNALGLGHIPIVLSGAAPAITTLFQDVVVWDAFIAVARRPYKRRSHQEARKGRDVLQPAPCSSSPEPEHDR